MYYYIQVIIFIQEQFKDNQKLGFNVDFGGTCAILNKHWKENKISIIKKKKVKFDKFMVISENVYYNMLHAEH